VAEDPENRILVPIHARIIPHAVEARDVVREGGGRWRRDVLGSERNGAAIAKPQCSSLQVVACHWHAWVGASGYLS
jgi:hypothetical protein